MKEQLLETFQDIFGEGGEVEVYFSPGRVNLIGEHTDYNGGHVFPCALTMGTYGVVRKNNSNILRLYSLNFKHIGMITSSLDQLDHKAEDHWANYPKAVCKAILENGYQLPQGMDILYYGTLPNRSGLSSSASIEILTGYIIKSIFQLPLDMVQLAKLCKVAENRYIGVNCGIMDPFAIAMGKEGHGIFLDTTTLHYEYSPIRLNSMKIIIANTNKKRELSDSKYNERRKECQNALMYLQKVIEIESLGDLNETQFEALKGYITDPICRKRAKHVVYENQRTIQAVHALKKSDLRLFGQLMKASHISLRDDYEVTGKELDTLVTSSWKQKGVIGARMTGAGFGGCTVNIVSSKYVESFIYEVGRTYEKEIGYKADFYVADIGGGPYKL